MEKIMSYDELNDMIATYIGGWRKKVKPEIARSLTVCGMKFVWSDVHNKYYDPRMHECRVESRMTLVLKSKGINPKDVSYCVKF